MGSFEVLRIPLRQLMTIDGLDAVSPGHRTFGLVEFDVTEALARIGAMQQEGRRVTLTAFVVACIGEALAAHPGLNCVRSGRSVYRFADVDVNLSVEVDTPKGRFPHQLTVRRAQDKDAEAVYAEIDQARRRYASGGAVSGEDRRLERTVRLLSRAPRLVRIGALRVAASSAIRVKSWSGTTFVTSLAKFGETGGFILPFASGPVAISFALGGLSKSPVCIEGRHEQRDRLAVTVIVNHDLVDGAPAARFVQHLQQLVQTAEGLRSAQG